MFALLKFTHVSCALLSIAGFALRTYWMFSENPLLRHRLARVLPHCIDTLLLGSALGMLYLWRLSPLQSPWLSAKIVALLLYIGLGMVALRFGRTLRVRTLAGLSALLVALYILSVAYSHSPWGLLAL